MATMVRATTVITMENTMVIMESTVKRKKSSNR